MQSDGENQLQEGEAEQHRGPTTIFKRVQSVGLLLPELGDGHLTGRDESRYAAEQSDEDQQAQDQFDQTSPPERLGANRHGARVDGPGEQLGCTMDGVQEIQDDAKMLRAAEELVLSRASRLDVMGRPPCAVRKFATRAAPLPGRH